MHKILLQILYIVSSEYYKCILHLRQNNLLRLLKKMWSKTCFFLIYAILCGIVQYNVTHAKRILVIANYPSYSHQIIFRSLCLELNKQGYEIVSVTTDPIKNSSLKNYREIDLKYFYNGFPEYKTIPFNSFIEASLQLNLLDVEESVIWTATHIINREVFKNPEMKKLYAADSNEHFDAVIVAQGPTQIAMNAFAYRFNASLIGKKKHAIPKN